MDKQSFEQVKAILTTHQVYSNETIYSLSLLEDTFGVYEYHRINVYSNRERGTFNGSLASFFCHVAEVSGCYCAFRSVENVCICSFY